MKRSENNRMRNRKAEYTFIISSTILVLIVLLFTGGLNIASFNQNYTQTVVSSYTVAAGETVRKIEYAVKYGKPLDNFLGIEDLLKDTGMESMQIEAAEIIVPDGRVIYDQSGSVRGRSLPNRLVDEMNIINTEQLGYSSVLLDGKYNVLLQIHNRDGERVGNLRLVFDQSIIKSQTSIHSTSLIVYLIILAALALMAIVIFIYKFKVLNSAGQIRRKGLLIALLVILGIIQIAYGTINYLTYQSAYIGASQKTVAFTTEVIQKDIDSVIDKGVPYSKLYNLEDYLNRIKDSVPVIGDITVSNEAAIFQYTTSESTENVELKLDHELQYTRILTMDSEGSTGFINIDISKTYITSKLRDIVLDTLTVLVTSFLFMVEVTIFVMLFLRKKLNQVNQTDGMDVDTEMIRPLAFFLCIAIFMSTSFIPVYMKQFAEPLFGLSKEVIIALPISLEMLFAAISSLIAGYIIDKKGWRYVFFLSIFIFGAGTLLSGYSSDALMFIASRCIVGFGYGFALISMRGYVNQLRSSKERTKGFSVFFAGMYAGVNCGVIVGAMLADRIGFSYVFYVAACTVVLAGIFVIIMMKTKPSSIHSEEDNLVMTMEKKSKSIFSFLTNRQIVTFFLLILIPMTACGMFLDYYFPLFAASMDISASNVGRAFLLNGLCIVYLGPLLSKYTTKSLGYQKSLILSGLIITGALLLFTGYASLLTAFIAVLLLGIAESFGLVAQNSYFLSLKAAGHIGLGKASGYFDNVRKLGQMLGPLAFGAVAFMGTMGVGLIGAILFGTILMFFIFTQFNRVKAV